MAGTMGGFYIGTSGMQANQHALNVTAHNITNADTLGYSRQQVLLSDVSYSKLSITATGVNQVGTGTKVCDVRLIRDTFVDRAYRTEYGRETYYGAKSSTIAELENYFGELESSDFRSYLQDLWSSAQELQKESNSIVTRSSYIATAVSFIDQANKIYNELTTYQKNLNGEIADKVDRINELADIIHNLNYKIMEVEGAGVERANDYRDQRDTALDELSGLISISYKEYDSGQVEVYAEKHALVTTDRTFKMTTRDVSESCDYYVPIWEEDQEEVFNLFTPPSAEAGTDVGSLKGIIMSRGDWIANYTDVPIAPEAPVEPAKADYANEADYQQALLQYDADYQQYQEDYEQFLEDKEFYNTYVEPYTVNNIIAQFDQLIHGVVTKINDALCPNKEITIIDETGNKKTIQVLDEENAGYGMGEENRQQGAELFCRRTVDRYTEQTVTLEDGTTATVQVYNEENAEDYLSLYTLGNVSINDDIVRNPSLLPLTNLKGEELQDVADKLITMWKDDFATIGPNSLVVNNFMGYYSEFVADYANKGNTYSGIETSQNKSVQELDNQRQMVSGVSTDEELSNLIRYQQGFNASARYFNVVSEMVEHLLNKLG